MKEKPILNESTVRKFMKLANLSKVGESFISENFEAEEALEEDKHFGGTKGHAMKPAPKAKKVMQEQDEMPEEPAAEPMAAAPEVAPSEEPNEMDASALADQIIQVLQGAGLVDVVGDDEGEEEDMGDMEDMGGEAEDEVEMDGEEEGLMEKKHEKEEEEEAMHEAKKRQIAKLVAERVMNRLQREQKVDRLAETITKRVMARMSGK